MKRTPGVAGGFILPAAGPGRQLLSDDERSVAEALERSDGRKLTGQEVNLSLAKARALVETD
jgi:hypothetical protein